MVLLNKIHYIEAGNKYHLDPAIIEAVAKTESAGAGFYLNAGVAQGELKVLFEGHYFHKLTNGKFSAARPDLSYKVWTTKFYRGGQQEFSRFLEAHKLDQKAALESTSWGKFQIMGSNYKLCGYNSAKEMVQDFYKGEDRQLNGFLLFCQNNINKRLGKNLIELLQHYTKASDKISLEGFVEKYNGKGQVVMYSGYISSAYKQLKLSYDGK